MDYYKEGRKYITKILSTEIVDWGILLVSFKPIIASRQLRLVINKPPIHPQPILKLHWPCISQHDSIMTGQFSPYVAFHSTIYRDGASNLVSNPTLFFTQHHIQHQAGI